MSTFSGIIDEFPLIRIDNFGTSTRQTPIPHALPSSNTNKSLSQTPYPAPLATFLSHIHTDHLRGLVSYHSPFIYCTHATRQLLLRIEKFPHRLNFAKGVLESRIQTYKHLKRLLRPLPLRTPTSIELCPGETIRVTLYDANHCPGSVMFLIEGLEGKSKGKSIIYTGDVRIERWWIENLKRETGLMRYFPHGNMGDILDCIYLDTSFASEKDVYRDFPSKRDGIMEVMRKVKEVDVLSEGTAIFYFNTWTFGYEEVWIALAAWLDTKIHVDGYRWKLYKSLGEGEGRDISEDAPISGFKEGNRWHDGCITRETGKGVRIHSCEKGMGCDILKSENVIQITPIVTRYKGVEYSEIEIGGGHGDLNQVHELELLDLATLGALEDLCQSRLKDRPDVMKRVTKWLEASVDRAGQNIRLDTEAFYNTLGDDAGIDALENISIERLIEAIDQMTREKKVKDDKPSKYITFPFSRHSSMSEQRMLVELFRPRSVYPNTYEPGMNMQRWFGDLVKEGPQQTKSPKTNDDICEQSLAGCNEIEQQRPLDVIEEEIAELKALGTEPLPIIVEKPPTVDLKRCSSTKEITERDQNSVKRRKTAFTAALDVANGSWARDVDLMSVSGYHNENEIEL